MTTTTTALPPTTKEEEMQCTHWILGGNAGYHSYSKNYAQCPKNGLYYVQPDADRYFHVVKGQSEHSPLCKRHADYRADTHNRAMQKQRRGLRAKTLLEVFA